MHFNQKCNKINECALSTPFTGTWLSELLLLQNFTPCTQTKAREAALNYFNLIEPLDTTQNIYIYTYIYIKKINLWQILFKHTEPTSVFLYIHLDMGRFLGHGMCRGFVMELTQETVQLEAFVNVVVYICVPLYARIYGATL